jgi:hypothetical protein
MHSGSFYSSFSASSTSQLSSNQSAQHRFSAAQQQSASDSSCLIALSSINSKIDKLFDVVTEQKGSILTLQNEQQVMHQGFGGQLHALTDKLSAGEHRLEEYERQAEMRASRSSRSSKIAVPKQLSISP